MFFDTKECEWADMEILFNGVKIGKATGLKYKKTQEKEHLYASGNEPISIQKGNKGYEGSLSLLKGAVDDIISATKAAGGEDILDAEFTLVCVYKARGNRALKTDTIVGAEFTEFEYGLMQNDKKSEIALPIKFLRLVQA